jgi:hypothetical protein
VELSSQPSIPTIFAFGAESPQDTTFLSIEPELFVFRRLITMKYNLEFDDGELSLMGANAYYRQLLIYSIDKDVELGSYINQGLGMSLFNSSLVITENDWEEQQHSQRERTYPYRMVD